MCLVTEIICKCIASYERSLDHDLLFINKMKLCFRQLGYLLQISCNEFQFTCYAYILHDITVFPNYIKIIDGIIHHI